MAHWQILLHALDRTGPPRLAQAFIRQCGLDHPNDSFEIFAIRGGALATEFAELGPVRIAVDDGDPPPVRDEFQSNGARLGTIGSADAVLLVSVSAAPLLWMAEFSAPVVTWVVEIEEDYDPVLIGATSRWLAGSFDTRDDVVRRLAGMGVNLSIDDVTVVPEFISVPEFMSTPSAPGAGLSHASTRRSIRAELGLGDDVFAVIGAGIGTERKGCDLFIEVALMFRQRFPHVPSTFMWVGGQNDELLPIVHRTVIERAIDHVRFVDEVDDVARVFGVADAFLHTARQDAFPLVCLISAAVATPVVAFAGVGGVVEMMGEAFVGAAYPDVTALVKCLGQLTSPEYQRRVGEAQQERVASQFLAPKCAPRLRTVLLEVA